MDAAEPLFSVLIVNFNGAAFIEDAVESVLRQRRADAEILVLDNASTDDSLARLGRFSDEKRVRVIASRENLGFAAGNNLLARHARGRWLALLNPDCRAEETWLEALAAGIRTHPDDRLFASLQLALDDPSLLDGAGDNYLALGIPWRGGYARPVADAPDEPSEVFSPCGAAMVVCRKLYDELGGFEESFFCYCEDVDFGFRARLLGHRTVLLPRARVHHAGSGILGVASDFSLFHGTRNRYWVFLRAMPGWSVAVLLLPHIAVTLAICAYGLRKGRAKASLSGFWAGFRATLPVLRQRRRIQAARRATTREILGAMSWNPARMLRRQVETRALDEPGPRGELRA